MFSESHFCSLSVWDLLRLTPWVFWCEIFNRSSSLCLLSFGWDLSPRFVPQDWQEILYWSLLGLKGRFVRVWNCLIFFRVSILIRLTWNLSEIFRVLSRIQWRFLRGISGKNYFRRTFRKFLRKPRLSSTKTCENSPYFLQFLLCFRIALKNFTQVLLYVVCTQVRRHDNKRITKRRYEEEKPRRFVFEKPI